VVALDLTGHGAAPPLPEGADAATLAADVLAAAHDVGGGAPLALVGHSLGGRVALRAAELAPDRIASVTLLDIAPGPLAGRGEVGAVLDVVRRAPASFASRAEARARLTAGGLAPPVAEWLLLNLEPAGRVYQWRIDREALARLHARVSAEDLWPVVERAGILRLTCVRGAASDYVSEADAQRLEAAGAQVVTIAEAGHFLHVERPQAVLDAVVAAVG
jgi:pimeloyl-ACP methyl ester carboxylesterase